jgi:hypothetical protein
LHFGGGNTDWEEKKLGKFRARYGWDGLKFNMGKGGNMQKAFVM